MPKVDGQSISESYGWARFPETHERISYGRFRNVYLYINEKCQLRCGHCYMGDRLERALTMPMSEVEKALLFWRRMGGSKLTILGGEATLHPHFVDIVRLAKAIGYEKVILTTNGLKSAVRRLEQLSVDNFTYVQVSLDGGSSNTHDQVRGDGMFDIAWETTKWLAERGFDTRIICTVNRKNMADCLSLLPLAQAAGVSLVKYHVFSGIGNGNDKDGIQGEDWLVDPLSWIKFCERLEEEKSKWSPQIWYQPTYALRSQLAKYVEQGYQGCIGRTMDRISIFPDGRAYICSYLFDTKLNYATWKDGEFEINRGPNEVELFCRTLMQGQCGGCKETACMGGCPAETLALGGPSCGAHEEVVPICRLWKSDI